MDPQGMHSEHQDALDDLLRRYMLENDPETEEGESLLELAGESVLSTAPLLAPSAERAAEMVARLRGDFPPPPDPALEMPSGTNVLKRGLIGFGALAVLTALLLLTLGIFANEPNSTNEELKTYGSPDLNTLADAKGMQPRTEDLGMPEELTSLHLGDGNPLLYSDPSDRGSNNERDGAPGNILLKPAPPLDHRLGNPKESGPYPLVSSPTPPHVLPVHMEEAAPDPFPLRGLFAQTSPSSEYHLLEADKDHLIHGREGTILHIPKDAFVGESGESVSGMVQVELKEVYDKAEYIKGNLPTVSNGRQLVSGGVIYVDATAAGRRLKLDRGKEIYVEFGQRRGVNTRDMELWNGEFNNRGEMNWVPAGGKFDRMIPLSLDQLYFDEFICDCKGEGIWNRFVWAVTDPSFQNTWIATREFRQRLRALRDIGYYEQGLIYYSENTRQPLWKVDQQVAAKLQADAEKGIGKEEDAELFRRFAQELLTGVEAYNDRGVDLDRWDARRQLMYRNVSREETERLMRLHKLRKEFGKEIESRLVFETVNGYRQVKSVRRGAYRKAGEVQLKGFLLGQLGWKNLDKVADPTFAGRDTRKVKVRLTGDAPLDARKEPYEPINTFIVYKDMNSVVPGSRVTGQYSTFHKVPKNVDAWVVAIGYQDYVPYFGMVSLNGDRREVQVEMSPTTLDGYLAQLNRLN